MNSRQTSFCTNRIVSVFDTLRLAQVDHQQQAQTQLKRVVPIIGKELRVPVALDQIRKQTPVSLPQRIDPKTPRHILIQQVRYPLKTNTHFNFIF